jgi:hypothetical protein
MRGGRKELWSRQGERTFCPPSQPASVVAESEEP